MNDVDHRLRELVVRVAIRTTDGDLFSALGLSSRASASSSRVDISVDWTLDTNTLPRFRTRLHLPVLGIEQFRGWSTELRRNESSGGIVQEMRYVFG